MAPAAPSLDPVDLKLVQLLMHNGRLSNHALAEATGIAESTCHSRVRGLVESGVIEGFRATVNPAALGRPLQAMVLVKVQSHARSQLLSEAHRLAATDGVLEVLFLTGAYDLMVHVAVANPTALRDFVVRELSASSAVAATETSVVMERLPGHELTPAAPAPTPPSASAHGGRGGRRP
jgi:DNA-binding Lrp family transcriptional regulator